MSQLINRINLELSHCYYLTTSSFPLSKIEGQKITAVALGCIGLFYLQLGFSPIATGVIALTCSSATLLSERFLRKESTNSAIRKYEWFNWKALDKQKLATRFGAILIVQLIVGSLFKIAQVPIIQDVAKLITARNMKFIVIASIIAPICEEILFRGFLKERLEDINSLASRHVYPISVNAQQTISSVAQAVIFGALHMNQFQTKFGNGIIFLATGTMGLVYDERKEEEKSLFYPIGLHMSQNISCIIRLLVFEH